MTPSRSGKSRGVVAAIAIGAVVGALLLALFEGCASLLIVADAALTAAPGPVLRRHDAELGWVSLPSLSVEGLWGPGRDLHTNARAFRGAEEVAPAVPPGRIRVLCSGDSFAFGEGVGDEDTWCHHLGLLDARIEPVNLGQSGYGVDQALLRFRRDAEPLAFDLHVFSFIGPDLSRAGESDHHGFAKPLLRLEDDALRVTGVPVPERGPALRRLLGRVAEQLRGVQLVRRVAKKLGGRRAAPGDEGIARLAPLLERVFDEVAALTAARGGEVLFVYLPLSSEIAVDGRWRGFLQERFARTGLPFLDLTDTLRADGREAVNEWFIPDGAPAGGHYSERGNARVAHAIYDALRPRLRSVETTSAQ